MGDLAKKELAADDFGATNSTSLQLTIAECPAEQWSIDEYIDGFMDESMQSAKIM